VKSSGEAAIDDTFTIRGRSPRSSSGSSANDSAYLVAVLAQLPRWRDDAGVVHEQIEARVVTAQVGGEPAHVGQRREVGAIEARGSAAGPRDLLHDGGAAFGVAAVHDDVQTLAGKAHRHLAAETVGGSGHQCHALSGRRPGGRRRGR
jgi:hypothetical protein